MSTNSVVAANRLAQHCNAAAQLKNNFSILSCQQPTAKNSVSGMLKHAYAYMHAAMLHATPQQFASVFNCFLLLLLFLLYILHAGYLFVGVTFSGSSDVACHIVDLFCISHGHKLKF